MYMFILKNWRIKMEKLKEFSQLSDGCTITKIKDGEFKCWEYLMIHPKNQRYILALNSCTQNADKLYIPDLFEGYYYVGDFDGDFSLRERLKQYELMEQELHERIQHIHSLLSKDKSEDKDEESWEEILKHESFG